MDIIFLKILFPVFLTADGKLVRDFLLGVLGEGDGLILLNGLEILNDRHSPKPDDLVVDVALDTVCSVISHSTVLFWTCFFSGLLAI